VYFVEQQSEENLDIRNQKISELEAKLNNANQIIVNLQQQNSQLKKYIDNLETDEFQQKLQSTKQNIKLLENREIIRKSQFSQLSGWQFYGLISLVVIFMLGLFRISTLLKNPTNNRSLKNSNLSSKSQQLPNLSVIRTNIPIESNPLSLNTPVSNVSLGNNSNYVEFAYNVVNPPNFTESKELDKIIQGLTKLAKSKNLPVESLSITVIDIYKQTIGGYKQKTLRYPASVVKLFWIVVLEAKINQGLIQLDSNINSDLEKIICKSDNDAASEIVDIITQAQSLKNKLNKEGFIQWKKQRQSINRFFQKANYQDINITQKTFPIPNLKINEPQGTDLQIRGDNPQKPIRNKITTYHAARLMYEIVSQQAVSPEYSQQMIGLLVRDLRRESWKFDPPNLDEFNPVENFLGEGLANEEVKFASKAGWTTSSRQEVAYISTLDGKTRYILAIFGDDPAYGKSRTIFPEMSKLVFESMTKSNL